MTHTADLDRALAKLLHDAPVVIISIATRDDFDKPTTYRVHAYPRTGASYEADGRTPGEALADVADQIATAQKSEARDA